MATIQDQWRSVGQHQVRSEGDLFIVVTGGELTSDNAKELIAGLTAVHAANGMVIVILDVSQGMTVGPEARRRIAAESKSYPNPLGVIVIGASLSARAIISLVNQAVRLFSNKGTPLFFCDSDDNARRQAESLRTKAAARPRAGQ